MNINQNEIKREENMKFLGVLYKARYLLNSACTKRLYFSFIHSYLNYGNIAWGSTNKTKLNVILRRQNQASRIIYFKNRYTHARPLLKDLHALNIYQLNINNTLLFMHKVKNNTIPNIFRQSFKINKNKYNTMMFDLDEEKEMSFF